MAAAPVIPASPESAPGNPPLSEGARIVNTFIAPSKTFTDIKRNAAWWAPLILISIFALVQNVAIGKQIGWEQVVRNSIERSPKQAANFDKLTADQQAGQVNMIAKGNKYASYAVPVFILLFGLIAMLPLWLTLKFMGGETTFGQAFAIMMYSWLPGIFTALLATISLFAGVNPEGFDAQNPAGTNLGYYLDGDSVGRFVKGLATGIDVFMIWSLVLVAIGFACTSKVKRSTTLTVVIVWYLVYKLAASALGAM